MFKPVIVGTSKYPHTFYDIETESPVLRWRLTFTFLTVYSPQEPQ
jgi:hypothetical protein